MQKKTLTAERYAPEFQSRQRRRDEQRDLEFFKNIFGIFSVPATKPWLTVT